MTKFAAAGSAAILAIGVAGGVLASDGSAASRGATLAINGQGKVVINHAEVTAVAPASLTVKVWGTSWTVNVGTDAKIVRKHGGTSGLGEFSIGDFAMVRGDVVNGQLVINATHLRNESTREVALRGTVQTVTAPDTFTVSTERGVKTVKVTSGTAITSGDAVKTFADITVGAKVQVKGFLNAVSETITAQRVNIKA